MTITSLNSILSPELAADKAAGLISTATYLDMFVYATQAEMPAPFSTGIAVGSRAFCQGNNTLYAWSGSGWYTVAVINNDLTLTQAANVSYTLATDGTPTYVNLAATSSNPVTWTYAVSGNVGNSTVAHTGGDFSITPSTSVNDNGVFLINFTANDGTGVVGASSEFSLTIVPYTGQPYGWFGGGWDGTRLSTIDRIDYTADTSAASVRSSLNSTISGIGATGNTNYGWFGGGYTNPGPVSTVQRIDYASDTGIPSIKGPLSLARYGFGATGNTNYGWFAGGVPGLVSIVDRVDYADDTATASVRGPLSIGRYSLAATGNNSYGWFGGRFPSTSIVDRIDYLNDLVTASVRGSLSAAKRAPSATGNTNYGWFGGGNSGVSGLSVVDRIDYAADTGTASVRGPLSLIREELTATGSDNYGWFGGGVASTTYYSIVDRVDYADDTATASVRGPLSIGRYSLAATGGYPG